MSGDGKFASPPCMATDVDPAYFDPLAVDPGQARDVARWRRSERARLVALRDGVGQAGRSQVSDLISRHLGRLLDERTAGQDGTADRRIVLSGYWPIKGEPDLRPLLAALHDEGVIIALPVVEVRAAPLIFRCWTPGTKMVRGDWNIPIPPPEAARLTPDITLAPCLGWDDRCFRLGWGGGYFDRTLAVLKPRPLTIGVALTAARLPTIHPQPHDIALDLILTEDGGAAPRTDK